MPEFNRQITGYEAVRRAMAQLGLPAPTSVVGNTDATVAQMVELLNQAGLDLVEDEYKWQVLCKTQTIVTSAGQLQYALPDDWAGYYSETFWNNTAQQMIGGAPSPQIWRMMKTRSTTGQTFMLQYTLRGDSLTLLSVPATSQTLNIDYQSRAWVRDGSNTALTRDFIKTDSDVILLNASLITALLKLKWRIAKGFDTSGAQREYEDAYAHAKGVDGPGTTLSVTPTSGFPYLGYDNIPDTGYGA
jgi:hypothetical protein